MSVSIVGYMQLTYLIVGYMQLTFPIVGYMQLTYLIVGYMQLIYLIVGYMQLIYLIVGSMQLIYLIVGYMQLTYLIVGYMQLFYLIVGYMQLTYLIVGYMQLIYLIVGYMQLIYLIVGYMQLFYLIVGYMQLTYLIVGYMQLIYLIVGYMYMKIMYMQLTYLIVGSMQLTQDLLATSITTALSMMIPDMRKSPNTCRNTALMFIWELDTEIVSVYVLLSCTRLQFIFMIQISNFIKTLYCIVNTFVLSTLHSNQQSNGIFSYVIGRLIAWTYNSVLDNPENTRHTMKLPNNRRTLMQYRRSLFVNMRLLRFIQLIVSLTLNN